MADEVLDAERIAARMGAPPADIRAYLLALFPDAEIAPLDDSDPDASPLAARVNHGMWIASCPCGTLGAPAPGLTVWLSIPWGWCIRCGNREARGRWRPVALPTPDERAAIEAVLNERTEIQTRNWEPGETVADLAADNAAHDLERPSEARRGSSVRGMGGL